jgi:hypothetical protein
MADILDLFVIDAVVCRGIKTHLALHRADTDSVTSTSTYSRILAVSMVATSSACVHAQLDRVGRAQLGDGSEGLAPIVAAPGSMYESVALITVSADGIATEERLGRHLQRRASLLGCDALTEPTFGSGQASATCLRERVATTQGAPDLMVADPSPTLIARAKGAGAIGTPLLQVLGQLRSRHGAERVWAVRWYLETYPDSPFRAEVEALLTPVPTTTAMALTRSAASAR